MIFFPVALLINFMIYGDRGTTWWDIYVGALALDILIQLIKSARSINRVISKAEETDPHHSPETIADIPAGPVPLTTTHEEVKTDL